MKNKHLIILKVLVSFIIIVLILLMSNYLLSNNSNKKSQKDKTSYKSREISIMASGDMLYHDIVYWSAKTDTGYDFSDNYKMIKPLISSADLAIGDFEGTISKDFELNGYPLFNAPPEVVSAIKDAGFDVIDLAHNHILDSHLKGALDTKRLFEKNNLSTIGIKESSEDKILVKNVKGVKVAIVGFSYGYNGMEALLTESQYNTHMMDLDEEKVKNTLKEAEKLADVTVVMPQMGVEYSLKPNDEQIKMYHNMIEWGADIIFGGHPHVIEPTEIVKHKGENKFILYSMGNLLSNQRLETLDNIWTERGVIMQVNLKKNSAKLGDVTITGIIPHPTWVSKTLKPGTHNAHQLYKYQTLLCEDYIKGGKYYNTLDENSQNRIESAYYESMKLLNVDKTLLKSKNHD